MSIEFGGMPPPTDKTYVKGELSASCGPFSLGVEAKLNHCGEFGLEPTCGVGTIDPCGGAVDPTTKGAGEFAESVNDMLDGKLKCKPEASVKAGGCVSSAW